MQCLILLFILFVVSISQTVTCPTDKVYVKFTKTNGGNFANEEQFVLYYNNGKEKAFGSPMFVNNEIRVIETCIVPTTNNQYEFKLIDGYGDSWENESTLTIEGLYGNRFFKAFMVKGNEESYNLSLYYGIYKYSTWKLTSGSVTGEWTAYAYVDSSWSEVTLGSVAVPVSGVQYFRKQFVGLTGMAAYEVSFAYRCGIVAYVNGEEIYRDNMPAGTPTSTTTSTGSYPVTSFHNIIRPGNEVSSAQSILAVELHFATTAGQTIVDFDAFLAILSPSAEESPCFVYPYDTAVTNESGNNMGKILDFRKWDALSISNPPVTLTLTFSGAKPYINGLRVYPYSSPTTAPSTFSLQGASSPTSTWNNAVVGNGIPYTSGEYKTVNGFFGPALYNNYRMILSDSASGSINAYEVQPVICSITIPTSIVFEPNTISAFAIYEDIEIRPIISEFTNCTIAPTIPDGLEFDATTCTLSGRGTSTSSTTFTVTSLMGGQSFSGSFTLQINTCVGTVVNLRRVYRSNAFYEAFTIKDSAQAVVAQVTQNSGQPNNAETNTALCLTSDKYTIDLSCGLAYWYQTSFLYVNAMLDGVDDYETILQVRHDANNGLPTSYTFNAQYAIKPYESWNYLMGSVPANWYGSDMTGWTAGTTGEFPSSSNQIQLYKKTFTVSSLSDVAGLVVSLKYQYGIIIYLNNHEVFRKGFTGDLSTSTYSSTSLSNVNFRQISLPIKTMGDGTTTSVEYVTTGSNTIAIGLVAAGPTQTTASFDCAIRFVRSSGVSRAQTPTASYSGLSGNLANMYNKAYSYTMYSSSCNNNYIHWTFPDDRHEWISSVVIKLYYTQGDQHPRQFTVKAKNAEDTEWVTLKTVTGLTWSLVGQLQRIWITNNKSYNQYRLENVGTGIPTACSWKISYFDFLMDATNIEVPALSYPAVTSIFKDIEMGEIYPETDLYTGFTVSPALPNGVVINPETGVISGTASAVIPATTYTISAKKFSTGETVTAPLSLAVEICTGGKSLITFVARADGYPQQCSYKVYQGKGSSGSVVAEAASLDAANTLNYGDFCLNHGIYTLEVKDTSTGWNIPGGYYLTVDVGEMKFEMGQVYRTTSPATVTKYFSSYLPFQIEYDDWKVHKDTSVAENWQNIDFDDSAWTVTKAADIGTNDVITTYIRREITLDDVANYHVLNVRVRYSGGVVAYFNGRKVARFNLEENFDEETESIAVHSSVEFSMFHIILNTVGAVTGKNIMAFEIHRPNGQSSSEPVVFDATGVFGVHDCSIGVDSYTEIVGTAGTTIGSLENFFDLTPATYGYQPNNLNTYLQWTVENLEGTKFNSFALETTYARSSWGFSVYGRKHAFEDDDPDAEEYTTLYEGINQATVNRDRKAWEAPVGIAGFRQFRHEIDDTANSNVYIAAYILQYCAPTGEGVCPGIGDYPPVGEGQISPGSCEEGYTGYSFRTCSNGQLGPIVNEKCDFKVPDNLHYSTDRFILVMNTVTSIEPPTYSNIIKEFYLAENTYLPEGLELDPITGAITGQATEESGLKSYTIYGKNPKGATFTVLNISVRKGECKAEGNFPKTEVGTIAVYDCAVGGAYVGTQKRSCLLGSRDGEWQKIQGVCMPTVVIVLIIVVAIIIIAVVVMVVIRMTKKKKAVGGVKGSKSSSKSGSKKTLEKQASAKVIKV